MRTETLRTAAALRLLLTVSLCSSLTFVTAACEEPGEMTEAVESTETNVANAELPVAAQTTGTGETPYTVVCGTDAETGGRVCQVDKGTFVGWRMYHSFCHVCHAQDAVGSSFAPSLVERMQVIDEARYMDVMANGYTGQIGVMPGWKDNPNISKRYNEIYGYLMARADGVLPPGRPQKLPEPAE